MWFKNLILQAISGMYVDPKANGAKKKNKVKNYVHLNR